MKPVAIHREGARAENLAGRILCHDVRGHRNEIVFRKGHLLRNDGQVVSAGQVVAQAQITPLVLARRTVGKAEIADERIR